MAIRDYAFLWFCSALLWFITPSSAQDGSSDVALACENLHDQVNAIEDGSTPRFGRTICADVVAMDQMLVYNRFGSFNPFGMIYALRRDVVSTDFVPSALDADACDAMVGTESVDGDLAAGEVRLKDCVRARPLTLRSNVGDVLHIRLNNLLRDSAPGFSADFCGAETDDPDQPFGTLFHRIRGWMSEGDDSQLTHGKASCRATASSPDEAGDANWPSSRGANMAIQGLTAFEIRDGALVEAQDACKGLGAIAPGQSIDCYYLVEREGPFFMASTGAPSGGQGDGGSLVHGLFGAVIAEKQGTNWYRSQVSKAAFDRVWQTSESGVRHALSAEGLTDIGRYEATVPDPATGQDMPILNMLRADNAADGVYSLVYSDLNAVVHRPATGGSEAISFREFSVFFHDELKTFYPRNFGELGDFGAGQFAGVRNGFAINYGASGMGDILLANRKGIGPSANCQECLYEEFFLGSWANGDPALLEQFSDDPSNVHHSYLNDAVVFRNFHAGPKETHVFHLHAHQWFSGNDAGRGSYLDSQTVAPQQGFTYDIHGGGMDVYHRGAPGEKGWFETLGSGNRNRTVGDSIFHCHLYPHFAQGMWELWRVHDVLEDGSRKLPDGQWEPTLSLAEMNAATRAKKRPGSVDQATGRWIEPGDGLSGKNLGTPVPGLVPLPGQAWPLLPTYPDEEAILTADGTVDAAPVEELATFPGYPFYIAGQPGHRAPQAPMDIARELAGDEVTDAYLDGGLPRHIMTDGSTRALPFKLPDNVAARLAADPPASNLASAVSNFDQRRREALQTQILATALALGDLTMKFERVELDLLDYDGEPIERAAMAFHHNGQLGDSGNALSVKRADGSSADFVESSGGYASIGGTDLFTVNGAPPKPGAPFADPCGAPSAMGTIAREGANDYRFVSEGETFVILTAAAGQPLSGNETASDAEVSNWVEHLRSDRYPSGPPQLFYVDGTGTSRLIERGAHVFEPDPFLKGLEDARFTPDPAVVGYRRYEGSAVQVDLVTNRAGWHDPQARINVLSKNSDGYKDGGGRISPKVTASEEPFFFRALSGECIEFRHTNELPKDLEMDDFQVKTPTDTIGQHIHLVKFDVTASDGSGNGFNYEDGTFAPDEIAARICAAKNTETAALVTANRSPGALNLREFDGLCTFDETTELWKVNPTFDHKIWRLKLSEYRDLFQTTTQRWFADPILSDTRAPDDAGGVGKADRTLRTVFSHDHFGPSSIQQHGFYTALVIEPQSAQICDEAPLSCTPLRADRELVLASDIDVGARKVIVDVLPVDADKLTYREFALSIADFAVLYDPRHTSSPAELETAVSSGSEAVAMKGMVSLLCEATHAIGEDPAAMAEICESALSNDAGDWNAGGDGDVPPAWVAAGRPGDDPTHSEGMEPNLLAAITVDHHGSPLDADDFLQVYLSDYRKRAAGFDPADPAARLANPVAPPQRPESISVDHHDPYLVNYRGDPFPLRIGEDSSASSDCALRPLSHWVSSLTTGVAERCEISRQKPGRAGEMANVMLSELHEDPVTPIIQAFDNDPIQFRLIQGAQEVQHTFTIEGQNWPRNVDQYYPSAMAAIDDVTPRSTLVRQCEMGEGSQSGVRIASAGRPEQYRAWAEKGPEAFAVGSADRRYWEDVEAQLANCFNTEGRVAAQEIGISEHFEFRAAFLYDNNFGGLGEQTRLMRQAIDNRIETVGDLNALLLERQEALRLQLKVSDTPYHFGSHDALWNGAWGLIRVAASNRRYDLYLALSDILDGVLDTIAPLVRENPAAPAPPDILRDLRPYLVAPLDTIVDRMPTLSRDLDRINRGRLLAPEPPTVDAAPLPEARLLPLERLRDEALSATEALPRLRQDDVLKRLQLPSGQVRRPTEFIPEGLLRLDLLPLDRLLRNRTEVPDYKPVAECPANAPNIYTAVVAIEAQTVFGRQTGGTAYADGLRDPNGLFFALIDPRVLINPADPRSVSDLDIQDRTKWEQIPLSRIVTAIRSTYARPEPLVVNVNAGDCVFVTILNALRSTSGAIAGLADEPGDARMPAITSLNVERDWDYSTFDHDTPVVAQADGDRSKDAVSSARLSVSLPLPMLTAQSGYARPFGRNTVWALNGIPAGQRDPNLSIRDLVNRENRPRTAQIEQFQFYAGLAYADYRYSLPTPLVVSSITPPQNDFYEALGQADGIAVPDGITRLPLASGPDAGDQTIGRRLSQFRDLRAATVQRVQNELNAAQVLEQIEPSITIDPVRRNPPISRLPAELNRPRISLEGIERAPSPSSPSVAPALQRRLAPLADSGIAVELADGRSSSLIDVVETLGTRERLGTVATGALADRLGEIIRDYRLESNRLTNDTLGLGILRKQLVTHFVPYAFGALPLKSLGDPIGHTAHGLIGAITVVPQNATISEVRGPKMRMAACENPLIVPQGVRVPQLRLNDLGRRQADLWRIDPRLRRICASYVIAPRQSAAPIWSALLQSSGPTGASAHAIRQFTLFWQDGLNHRDNDGADRFEIAGLNQRLVEDCAVCDDTYDFGEEGVNYRSGPFHRRLRGADGNPSTIESHYDLNSREFGSQFFRLRPHEIPTTASSVPVLRALAGEEIVVHVVHPGGRARQRAFATVAQDYDDLFPGFGFPRAALLAPGKAITASLRHPAEKGCYLWFDGPLHLRSGGVWGLLDVIDAADAGNLRATSCGPRQ